MQASPIRKNSAVVETGKSSDETAFYSTVTFASSTMTV